MEGFLALIEALCTGDNGWIPWNLALACLPLALSVGLFRDCHQRRSWLWWTGWIVFLAVLPNAPYLLTDIVHLIYTMRAGLSVRLLTLEVFPLHLGAILVGFEAYVVSVMQQGHYVRRHGAPHLVVWTELMTHALCAVGIYLGRFQRFNSWDLLMDPGQVLRSATQVMTASRPLVVIGATFVILTLFYWCMKQLTLGMLWRIRATRGPAGPGCPGVPATMTMNQGESMRYTVLSVLLMCLCRPGISWAILGDSDASVLADQQRLQAQRYTTTETDYTVQQLETADGIVIREYVSPANMVFGVAWQGPKVPDLTQLFGAYFPLYQASFPTPVHRRSAIVIHTDDLVVEMTGHPRAFSGRAYIPSLVPSAVATEVIQ